VAGFSEASGADDVAALLAAAAPFFIEENVFTFEINIMRVSIYKQINGTL